MKILLLDDSPRHRRAGKRQLEDLGHEVVALCDYGEAIKQVASGNFDAALIDLLMPAEPTTLGPEAVQEFVGREIAIGFPLVLKLSTWVKAIAVATDTNHHNHPMSAAVDWFHDSELVVNGARVRIVHAPLCADGAKDWAKILNGLISG